VILRETHRREWRRFQDDIFVLTFHRIFGLRDANLLEFLFHVFVLPTINEDWEGQRRDFN
jgi:hypothetical protein